MRVPFDPPPGILSNDTIYAIPGAWADCSNMRFREGRAETIGGWAKIFATPLDGVCRTVYNWTNILGLPNVAFGTHTDLQVYVAGVLATITPAGLIDGAIDNGDAGTGYGIGYYGLGTYSIPPSVYKLRTWSLDSWGETLLGVPRYGPLYQWSNDTGAVAVEIGQAPDIITAMLVTPERQVLAFGCNEELSGDFNPLCIRGSDIEDLTDWTTSSSNNAFEHILEGGGQIVAAHMVETAVGVWTDKGMHVGQFVGAPDQTYRFDRVDDNCGAIGPNAVCVLKGTAYWVGPDRQIRAWAFGTKPSIIPCPIWKDFADHLDMTQGDKLIAVSNSRFDEVWFFYPDTRDGDENSRHIMFTIGPDGGPIWSKGDVARTAASDAGVLLYPQAVSYPGAVYYHEVGTDADGSSLAWSIRSAGQYLNEAEQVLQVQRLVPDFKGQENAIAMTLTMRERAQSAPVTKGPYAITTAATKVDFRASGAIAEVAFAGTDYVRFGKPTFDAVGMGQR